MKDQAYTFLQTRQLILPCFGSTESPYSFQLKNGLTIDIGSDFGQPNRNKAKKSCLPIDWLLDWSVRNGI